MLRYVTAPDGTHHMICQGERRFRVLQFLEGYPFPVARVQFIDEIETTDPEIEARAHNLMERAIEILQLLPQAPEEMIAALRSVKSPARLADFIAGFVELPPEEKQQLLEMFDLKARLDKLEGANKPAAAPKAAAKTAPAKPAAKPAARKPKS